MHSPLSSSNRVSDFSPNTSKPLDSGNFKQILREKLDNLYQKDLQPFADEAYQLDLGDTDSMLTNIENKDLQLYLDEEEDSSQLRKDKFRTFAKKYGLDQVIHLQQFLGRDSVTPISAGDTQPLLFEVDSDIDVFIRYVVKKLSTEQINRLKTEEQSA